MPPCQFTCTPSCVPFGWPRDSRCSSKNSLYLTRDPGLRPTQVPLEAPYTMILEAHRFSRSLLGTPVQPHLGFGSAPRGVGRDIVPPTSAAPHHPPSLRLQSFFRDSVCILTLPQHSSGPSPPFDLSALLQKELFIAKMMQNL